MGFLKKDKEDNQVLLVNMARVILTIHAVHNKKISVEKIVHDLVRRKHRKQVLEIILSELEGVIENGDGNIS